MEFTIYTFGDVEVFRAALAGVAMVFNPSAGFFVSDSGMGLGALAGLGLLIGLLVLLIQGITQQKGLIGGYLLTIIVFVVLFVPKFSVNIEDYNGAAIALVDDVPLGIAVPAAMVSGVAKEFNERLGTAYSTVQGYPSGMMTPQAISSPLKLLHSLRDASPLVRGVEPRLAMNIANIVAYCLAGRDDHLREWASLKLGNDPLATLLTKAITVSGLTMYSPADGVAATLHSCEDAARETSDQVATFVNDDSPTSKISKLLTASATRSNAAQVVINGNAPQVQPVTVEDMNAALVTMAETSSTLARNYVTQALFGKFIDVSFQCAGKSGNPNDWAECMPFVSANLAWAEDSAAGGSFFQRIMYHGMNMMFFMWICLSPVVALVMLIMGTRGLKIAGSYLLFGAWAVSWYVGASIVNFYMLKQVQYEIAMLGGIANLTRETMSVFFNALGVKIAMAGDMLASVPLIMMSVMSGSMYGMVSLAQRMGGRDYYDEKVNSPSLMGSAPIHQMQSASTGKFGGVSVNSAIGGGGSFDFSRGASLVDSNSMQSQKNISSTIMNGITNSLSNSYGNSTAWANKQEFGRQLASKGFAGMTLTDSQGRSYTVDAKEGFVVSDENVTGVQGKNTTTAGGSLGMAGPLAGKGGVEGGFKLGAAAERAIVAGESHKINRQNGQTASTGKSTQVGLDERTGQEFSRALTSADVASIAKTFQKTDGATYARTFGNNQQVVETFTESGGVINSVTQSFGSKTTFDSEETANRIKKLGLTKALFTYTSDSSQLNWSSSARDVYESAYQQASIEFSGVSNNESLIRLRALERTALITKDDSAVHAYQNMVRGFAGVDISGIGRVSGVVGDTYKGKAADWEGKANRGENGVSEVNETAANTTSPGKLGSGVTNGDVKVVDNYGGGAGGVINDGNNRLEAAAQAQKALVSGGTPGVNNVTFRPARK